GAMDEYARIPAVDDRGRPNVLHLYHQKRPGQTRGVPFFAPVLLYFQNLADYMEAELVAARMAACFGIIFNKSTANNSAEDRPLGEYTSDADGRTIEEFQPGMSIEVTDTDVTQIDPKRPGEHFDPFVARILRMICAGMGLPYEQVSKDFSQSNYSNMRAALLEARRLFTMHQEYFTTHLCQPSWNLVMEESWLRRYWGRNKKSFYDNQYAYTLVKWDPPGWEWVDPPREVKAAIDAVEHNLMPHSDALRQRGYSLDDTLVSNARSKRKQRELGLRDEHTEIDIDKKLAEIGVEMSKQQLRAIYHRDEPEGKEDSTVSVADEPNANKQAEQGEPTDE
ncbi:MAG TPA: phage portal protein, partial [Pirellulales bacterium]|nr:phage portal protein [Pirellulales bacterium]